MHDTQTDMADRCSFMKVFGVEDFLRNPPLGFQVETRGSGHILVKFDPNSCCVFIDEFYLDERNIIFQFSPGSEFVVSNLGDYTKMRKKITSLYIYLLASAGEKTCRTAKGSSAYLIVALNGSHPLVRWQLEQGLDKTISSVAGESFNVKFDVSLALRSWVGRRKHVLPSVATSQSWRDCSFTLKYHSDALFDILFWLGMSNKCFEITYEY